MTGPDRKYLIRKQGCYYRPNERGYTTSAIQAGRYTREDAEKITHPNGKDWPRDGMSFIHEDELVGIDEDWTAYSALLADRRDPAVLAALPEVQALIAAACEVAAAMIEDNVRHAKELGREIWPIPDLRTVTSHDATAALAQIEREAEARGLERAAARARVYASNYEQSSDGRNTFILLAEWADAEAAAILARADQIEKEGK